MAYIPSLTVRPPGPVCSPSFAQASTGGGFRPNFGFKYHGYLTSMNILTEWRTFYGLLGSAAGALTGLQFVTMALIADMPVTPGDSDAGETFATPTVVHFTTALVLAAILSAPWYGIAPPAILWGLTGVLGLAYVGYVVRRIRVGVAYQPVLEDWCFHVVLPALAYATLAGSAAAAPAHSRASLFAVAAAALLLLLIGIHNAWDNVIYLVLKKRTQRQH